MFDSNNQHGPVALALKLRSALAVFSRESLSARKKLIFGDDETGLEQYLSDIRVPGERELNRLERLAKGYTEQFNSTAFRELRSKVFAHKVYTKADKVTDLFSGTNIDDIQRMVSFLYRFHETVRSAYDNGTPLRLSRTRRSVSQMLEKPRDQRVVNWPAEEMTESTRRVLTSTSQRSPLA